MTLSIRTLAMLAPLLLPSASYAADAAFCDYYAYQASRDEATSENMAGNIDLGFLFGFGNTFGGGFPLNTACGFSGPRWSSDSAAHKAWCLGQDEATVNAEEAARTNDLKFCDICMEYVPAAMKAEASGNAASCSLTGADWPKTAEGMLQLCLGGLAGRSGTPSDTLVARLQRKLSDAKEEINSCVAAKQQAKSKRHVPPSPLEVSVTTCRWCKSKPPTVVLPGLLEGDQGSSGQGPAPTGNVAPTPSLRSYSHQ
jgi:hypothetical protein